MPLIQDFLLHIWFIATFGYIAIFWVHLHMDDRHLSYVKRNSGKKEMRVRGPPPPPPPPHPTPNPSCPLSQSPKHGQSIHRVTREFSAQVTGYRGHRRRRSQTSGRMELTWCGSRRTVGLRRRIGRTSLFSYKLQVSNFPPRERSKK
jgi:hypothetical protein